MDSLNNGTMEIDAELKARAEAKSASSTVRAPPEPLVRSLAVSTTPVYEVTLKRLSALQRGGCHLPSSTSGGPAIAPSTLTLQRMQTLMMIWSTMREGMGTLRMLRVRRQMREGTLRRRVRRATSKRRTKQRGQWLQRPCMGPARPMHGITRAYRPAAQGASSGVSD